MPDAVQHVLFPGRHHLLTAFQAEYLERVASGEVMTDDSGAELTAAGATVHVAITSWDHGATRRNPIPGHRREAIVERLALTAELECCSWPVPDVPTSERFASYVLESIAAAGGPRLEPGSCVVACSTPQVSQQYRDLGFRILPVELGAAQEAGDDDPARPWDVLEQLVAEESLEQAGRRMHPAALDVWRRYDLLDRVLRAHADPLLTDEGNITDTRDYATYAAAFDSGASRKWATLAPHVRPGRIVDVGCGAGSLLAEAAADPRLGESDLYGIEATRSLHDECVHRKAAGAFANPNTFFYQRNIMAEQLFDAGSIDTTISTALTHELYSYLDEAALRAFIDRIYAQTTHGGVWLNLDVCGPLDGDQFVWIEPRANVTVTGEPLPRSRRQLDVGAAGVPIPVDLAAMERDEVESLLPQLTSLEGFAQFAHDWYGDAHWRLVPAPSGADAGNGPWIETSLRTAMDWLSKKDYPDNWLSEMHEQFCFWDERDWARAIEAAGFELLPGSGGTTNPWLVEHRFESTVTLHPAGEPDATVPWPHTHVLLACRRPRRP
jgi:SAM-dependent methyltransferase